MALDGPRVLCLTLLGLVTWTQAQVLNPPYFNLAEGRRIVASATCGVGVGVSEPELYCKLVGAHADQKDNPNVNLIQGQVCDYCDPNNPELAHPPEYAIDGSERWWQSPPLSRDNSYNEVNLTIDLGQEFHVAYVFIKMANSPRPGIWVLERSQNLGETWEPWQYFADTPSDCVNFFGQDSLQPITADDSVICETKFSKVVPLEGGEVVVSLLNDRPSANDFYNSTLLQEWTKATNIRLRFIRAKTLLGHLMSVARQDPTVTRRYYYSIRDINVGGRCVCNGHADLCDITDPNDIYKLLCRCQHNTCGSQCEDCCPGFVQKKWRRATQYNLNECESCNCFGHSGECTYDEETDRLGLSLDIHGRYEGGGVCQNCQHNTEGVNCNKCRAGYFRPHGIPLNVTHVCQPCVCDLHFSTGSCADETGQCECRPEFLPPYCSECNVGYYGYPNCRPCDCNVNGTRGTVCEVGGGQCPCKPSYTGKNCDHCARDYYGFPQCLPCNCNSIGALGTTCDPLGGQCICKNNFGGQTCGECDAGFYDYPNCKYCNCDLTGTESSVCEKNTGSCICKEGFGGARCDKCAPGYFGYPNCIKCECNQFGAIDNVCDQSGKCRCGINFAGHVCDQCSPGYYRYPECIACNCDTAGSIGLTCDNDGRCLCKDNFDGTTCNVCKKGYYNYPTCEECNCNPAGVASTFAGCDSQSAGELCNCKERVTGRICNQCRPLFWNLQASNTQGCEDCNCHLPGTLGGIGICGEVSGQCFCKPNVGSRQCRECLDGSYELKEDNLFGCIDCGCDVGGAVSNVCDKRTGQCSCRPRVSGQTCDVPMKLHYFPTLFHHQYEAEDGHTPANTPVRFGYNELYFPGYSWRGYAVFSQIQEEVLMDVIVDKPSLYRIVYKYVNLGNASTVGSVTLTPESSADTQQVGKFRFEPTDSPKFGMATSRDVAAGVTPASFVLNPGRWTMTLKGEKSILLDYVVFLPAAYYEATILQEHVDIPCAIGSVSGEKCYHFEYPDITSYPTVKAEAAYIALEDKREKVELYTNEDVLKELQVGPMAILDEKHAQMFVELTLPKTGRYVLVILYHTPEGGKSTNVMVETQTAGAREKGRAILYDCTYSGLCRQIVTDMRGKVSVFNFDTNHVTLDLQGGHDKLVTIESVVAIPVRQWHTDYVRPSYSCVRENGKCLEGHFQGIPGSIKIEAETGNEAQKSTVLPWKVVEEDLSLVYLDHKDAVVDIKGKVPNPGGYVFVVHYYQTKHPEFDLDVLIQNGQFYEGTLPVPFCPSVAGCRAIVKAKGGGNSFQILENFMVTLREPNHKSVWIDYILAIPEVVYQVKVLEPQPLDRTVDFISTCGQEHFYLNPKEEGFCRNATFSLTSEYNNGGLPCDCDFDGSLSFECETFGGQCPCKSNIIGRRCAECRTGFYGFPNCKPCNCPSTAVCHPWTGECICPPRVTGEKCDRCVPNTYGRDPIIGCEECHCHPLGVKRDRLQCDLETGTCDCKPNVVNRTCNRCQVGYWNFPDCRLCDCDLRGTTTEICDQNNARCFCKENVYGHQCDQCKPGTFNLEERNPQGCTNCFCFGKATHCISSSFFRSKITAYDNWKAAALLLNPFGVTEHEFSPQLDNPIDDIIVRLPFSSSPDVIYYFSAPKEFLGNKVKSYGGKLKYTLEFTKGRNDIGGGVIAGDVILIGNNITAVFENDAQASDNIPFDVEVELREWNFRHWTGGPITREQIMMLLWNLEKVFIRVHYNSEVNEARLGGVSLEVAVPNYISGASQAVSIEQCQCPPHYEGSSCENCAAGYYRTPTGPFGGFCRQCECHGHADSCDPLTGVCINCKHNTHGDHCDKCDAGFHGNATIGSPNDCLICACPLPMTSNNFATACELSPSGLEIRCECKPGYTGIRCDYCAAGFFGQPEVIGDYCKPCMCSGNIDTNSIESCDSVTGQCLRCLNNTFGSACELCAPGFYGDAVESKNCRQCFCDKCGTQECSHVSGTCKCRPNVIGEKCEECAAGFWGFDSCESCIKCNCGIGSESHQCDVNTGQCRCRPGVSGRTCDKCLPGHWNLGPNGCQACRCNADYSIGGTCNTHTGRCECLPNVVGDKCDRCPHRWVLIDNAGCQECGPCIHTLLDDLDALHGIYDPVWDGLEGVAISYFAYQKLATVNKSIAELRPKVDALIGDPTLVDLGPLELNVASLEDMAKQTERQAIRSKEHANKTSVEADATRIAALNAEKMIKDTISNVKDIVGKIKDIASGFVESRGPNRDRLIAEAEKLLKEIKARDFNTPQQNGDNELQAAKDILEKAKAFALPAQQNKERLDALQDALVKIEDKLRDLINNSAIANAASSEAKLLNKKNENPPALDKVRRIKAAKEAIDKQLTDGDDLVEKAKALLEQARNNFVDLEYDDGVLKGLIDQLRDFVKALSDGLAGVVLDVRKADGHANKLMAIASELDKLLADTRESAENALKAAKSYGDIVDAIEEAMKAAQIAVAAANNASRESTGLDGKAIDSLALSKQLMQEALIARGKVEGDLKDRLAEAKQGVDLVGQMNRLTRDGVDELNRMMDRLPSGTIRGEAEKAKQVSDGANAKANVALKTVNDIAVKLPEDRKRANQIPRDVDDANQAIKRADGQVKKAVALIPELKDKMSGLGIKASAIHVIGKDVGEKIAELRRKIVLARDQANRINVGVRFHHNSTLQLQNPENLHRSATSTKLSLFFKTDEENGFLTYLGSPVGTRQRMKRALTDDYIALEIKQSNVVLTMDLGSGYKQIRNNANVADDAWHEVLVDRIGRTVTLTVRTEDQADAVAVDTLPGTFSVFNLDQEQSKFYVGGIPKSVNIQPEVSTTTFNGAIEELKFDEKPVGLWNFADGENNDEGYLDRDSLVIIKQTNGAQFDGSGYVTLPMSSRNSFDKKIGVILNFKTFADNGLLFLIGKGSKFFSLELVSGRIINRINLGSGPLEITFDKTFNDGQWHKVEASRDGIHARLKVDVDSDSDVKTIPGRQSSFLEFENEIFVGGYPQDHSFKDVTNVDFEGCMANVQIGNDVQNLNSPKVALGIVPGCPLVISRSVTFTEDAKGHIGMAPMQLGEEPQLTFKFKTSHQNGLLFFTGNLDMSSYLSFSLAEGLLFLRAKPGGDVQSSPSIRYDDSEWHYISATKNNSHLQLVIDDYEVFDARATSVEPLDTSTPLYFGGIPSTVALPTGASPTNDLFVGCIGDATINGKFQNFADSRDRHGAALISCPITGPQATVSPPYTGIQIETVSPTRGVKIPPTTARPRPTPPIVTPRPVTQLPTTTTTTTTTAHPTTTYPTTITTQPEETGLCKLPLRPKEDLDKSDINGIRFGSKPDSRVHYNIRVSLLTSKNHFKLEFKTTASDGILFFIADSNNNDMIASYIKGGMIVYVFNLGSGKLEITSKQSYNDNEWHTAEFIREQKVGTLIVDSGDRVTRESPLTSSTMNVLVPLYVGGLPESLSRVVKTHLRGVGISLDGCIRQIQSFSVPITQPVLSEGVTPCSSNIETGTFIGPDGGRVTVYDTFRVGSVRTIDLEIKPRNTSGVILAVHNRRKDFMALQIIEGVLKFSAENGAGIIAASFTSPNPGYFCDGEWHKIRAIKSKNVVTLSVDGTSVEPGFGVAGVSATDTNDPLYLGGMPSPSKAHGVETTAQFVGCIRNFKIDNKLVDMSAAKPTGDAALNVCPTT